MSTSSTDPEHDRIPQRLLLPLGDREDHGPGVRADVELGGPHQVPDVLDQQEVQRVQIQARQRRADHGRVRVTLPAVAVPGVDEADGGAAPGQPAGVQARLDVALDDADADLPLQTEQGLAQQGRLAGTR